MPNVECYDINFRQPMKAIFRSLLCAAILCFGLVSLCLAQFGTPNPPGSAAKSVASFDDFRALLCAQNWTWELAGRPAQTVTFAANGNVTNNSWVSRYMIIDLHKVTIHNKNGKSARITFADDYAGFSGLDFNETTPVSGKPLASLTKPAIPPAPLTPVAPLAAVAGSVKSFDEFQALLCAQPWSWELGDKKQTIFFAPNGDVTNHSWTSHYKMVDLHKVTFHNENGRSAQITFANDYSSFSGIDYDKKTPVSGKPKKNK